MKIHFDGLYKTCHPLTIFKVSLITASSTISYVVLILLGSFVYRRRRRIRHYWYRHQLRREYAEVNDSRKSRICLYEARSAHTSMVTEDRDAVVVVQLQPLPCGITGTLASLMQIRECLNWTEDPDIQNMFWELLEDMVFPTILLLKNTRSCS